MKTQDKNSVFIQIDQEGWKFSAEEHNISVETGLYFGRKNSFIENQNIFAHVAPEASCFFKNGHLATDVPKKVEKNVKRTHYFCKFGAPLSHFRLLGRSC